ncbi:hypothetical protein [Chitinophaga solisilvae]|uniref:Uncharacterized protein n=1 Tax=Chitinophaga solisilvae TaxID=1233460 RepID=A0A3S1D228_9BACT|nr:hypothetical protein [Chitinophaga solisilvae]NSL85911.1 hypothetical protein [Chitinophaga solisilvae]
MRKTNEKKLVLSKIKISSLSNQPLHFGKDATIFVGCNTQPGGGCIRTHYNTCGDCVPTFFDC